MHPGAASLAAPRPAWAPAGHQAAGVVRVAAARPAAAAARGRLAVAAASSGSGSPEWNELKSKLTRSASKAKEQFEEFARQQRLQEKLNAGLETAGRVAQQVATEAGRTAKKVDAELGVSDKAEEAARAAAKAAQAVNAAAEEADAKFQFKRKGRTWWSDFKRRAPLRMRAIGDFFNTPLGAVTFLFLFLISVFTGAFWAILRTLFFFMWIGILCGPLIINWLNAKAIQEQQQYYRQYMAEQQRRRQDPFFGTPLEGVFNGGQRSPRGQKPTDSGDVIDVSFEKLDD